MTLRTGITTGTCAAAAAKAAAMVLTGQPAPVSVGVTLPGGAVQAVAVLYARAIDGGLRARAAVRKDAGSDDDITDGVEIVATVAWREGEEVVFLAGEGVGTVTKPGLQIPPGQPAINPVPRQMIRQAVGEVAGPRGATVEISIPAGAERALQTFNPRLGVIGGLSILGTTGIVRPYCRKALRDALKCSLDVAAACGVRAPVLVPGNIGAKAARTQFTLADEQVVEVANEWDFVLELAPKYAFTALLALGHPGKLAKLSAAQWDTHSARSASPVEPVARLFSDVLHRPAPPSVTVEGVFAALGPAERAELGRALAARVRAALAGRLGAGIAPAVMLVNMGGRCLGTDGDLSPWK